MAAKRPDRKNTPQRVAPAESPADAVERIVPRRQLSLETGDIVITREVVPRVNPRPSSPEPQWRFRVCVHPDPHGNPVFTSFAHAASHAEQLASDHGARVMFIEEDVPTLLADYRRNR